jgi:hypothetical protein
MKSAEALFHPHTLVYTICHARAFMDFFNRRYEHTPICTENGFSHWINFGRIFDGLAKISRGDVGQGANYYGQAWLLGRRGEPGCGCRSF